MLPPTLPTLLAGIILFGVCAGGTGVTSEVIWAGQYGRLSLGAVRGIAFPIQSTVTAAGPLALGVLYDLNGSYTLAFGLTAGACLVSAVALHLARPPRRPT